MTSTGNDIISLELTDPVLTCRERFYSKLLSKTEVDLFKTTSPLKFPLESFIWLAWSIKESVYKFHKRKNQEILFSPTKIIVQKINSPTDRFEWNNRKYEAVSFDEAFCFCCETSYEGQKFFTRSLVSETIIFTVANNSNSFENVCWGIQYIDDDNYINQSQTVRDFMLGKLQCIIPKQQIVIDKTGAGYPVLREQENIAVSFSHHGHYVAYSFVAGE
ncbi:MAG: 4'-phosphopantetheinyl transferase superfamily protein [Bacteroidetes bacterium]|nr:4'-phosphopantetheinyl transferase superfamily protein [Bacteroidota bacterium]